MGSLGATSAAAFRFVSNKVMGLSNNALSRVAPRYTYPSPSTDHESTAYLDGLRGFASTAIVIYNLGHAIDESWVWGSGFGIPLTCVISGYVLSLKALQHVQNREWEEVLFTITSQTFRRVWRIYIPAVIATWIAFILFRLNFYVFWTSFTKPVISKLLRLPTSNAQATYLLHEDLAFLQLLRWSQVSSIAITPLWTLQSMMRGPLVLFLTIAGLSRAGQGIRSLVVALLMLVSYWRGQHEIGSMLGGMLLCDLHIGARKVGWEQEVPRTDATRFWRIMGLSTSTIILMIPATYSVIPAWLSSVGSNTNTSILHHLGAILFLWAIGTSSRLQKLFTGSTLRTLGKISYSIYLLHGPVIETFGYQIAHRLMAPPRTVSGLRYVLGMLSTIVITGVVIFSIASLFWKAVDLPVLKLMRAIEKKCSVQSSDVPLLHPDWTKSEKLQAKEVPSYQNSNSTDNSINSLSRSSFTSGFIKSIIVRCCWFLVPSFIQELFDPHPKKPHTSSTAWLDGLRGFAALFVFWYHLMNPFHPRHLEGYGYNPEGSHFIQLPILRLIYSGNVMVYIFFVISGYVLSIKSIGLIRSGRSYTAIFTTISSSIFRRAIRLALPPLISTFINMLLTHAGLFEITKSIADDPTALPGYREPHPQRLSTFSAQVWDWIQNSQSILRPYSAGTPKSRYDPHTWTINVEGRNSMLVFLYLICFARTKTGIRICLCLSLIFCLCQVDAWHESLFLTGILLAEINLMQASPRFTAKFGDPRSQTTKETNLDTEQKQHSKKEIFHWSLFLLSLYLASTPEREPWNVPGYRYLTRIVTIQHFWIRLGCPLIVFSISNSTSLKQLFSNRLARILANLSFACYLVHFTTIHTLAYAIVPALWRLLGKDTPWGYELSFVIGAVVVTIVTMWLSDIFWRAVDMPSVRFARWLERQCIQHH